MADNVINLNGGPVDRTGVPDAAVIDCCERLLAQARSGEINGIAFVTRQSSRDDPQFGRSGWADAAMLGACVALTEIIRAVLYPAEK